MTTRRISRRTVLRGLGATMALPLLDIMPLLSHIFSATAASEGLGNPVARAS